jgi:hypothetical protein
MLTESQIQSKRPDLYNQLILLLRDKEDELSSYLNEVIVNDIIGKTQTSAHCYFISLDGNRRPRVNDFSNFIARNITDYAIPRKEIIKALNDGYIKNSASPIEKINQKARNLFSKLPESGEGGEVLLSIMAESFLKLPQLFSKMVLKTNSQMHIHGADGIHAGINTEGNLALYWGESKLYADVTQAVRECLSSLAPYLLNLGNGSSPQQRDLQLIRDGMSIPDPQLEDALKKYLDPDNPLFNTVEYRGLCLVGFDSDKYPSLPNLKTAEKLKEEIAEVFHSRKSHIEKRLEEENIHSFMIQLFLLPFPDIEKFRKSLRTELGLSDG